MPERGLNKIMLIGRVGQDPDLRHTQSGKAVVSFSLATNEVWKDANGDVQQRTEWHRVEAWNNLAEIIAEYVTKGMKVYIGGSLKTDEWQDQEGQTRHTTKISANEMLMIENPNREQQPHQEQRKAPRRGYGSKSPQQSTIRHEEGPF